MNEPTDIKINTGAATASTRSPVAWTIRSASTASEASSTLAAQGRSRAGHTDHSSASLAAGSADAGTVVSGAGTLCLEVPPRRDALSDVQRAHASRLLLRGGEHELMHAVPLVGRRVRLAEARFQIIGVQDGLAAHLGEPRGAQSLHVTERPHQHAEISVVRVDAPDRSRPVVIPRVALAGALQHGGRKEGRQLLADAEQAPSG